MASGKEDTRVASDNGATSGVGDYRGGAFSDGGPHDVAEWAGDNGADDAAVYKWLGAIITVHSFDFCDIIAVWMRISGL